ncbi:hypothetical protein PLEOSDRAFT_1102782 [Pleurotus ostreatus PC15]|uniref:Tyr recombinase domain-containing protein n=1 Tax=Pleurotus ostreatus (strain PC15) TaxID=1137138 RepID=A0A067NX89_PLEO1|nr:hypothetical protein PLEOSDRAFT_1102782 [Pleurotus ostreatus PC15]
MPPKRSANQAPSTPTKRRTLVSALPPTPVTPSSKITKEPALPTVEQLLGQSKVTTDQWYRSKSTREGYANYVKAGILWLENWVKDAASAEKDDNTTNEISEDTQAPDVALKGAFEVIKEETPLALRLFITYKCDHQGRGFSTAEGTRSAFKDYFERQVEASVEVPLLTLISNTRVLGCQGEGWRFNAHTRTWEGNPVFQTDFKVYFESLKNRQNRTATATQALPMLPKDMKIIMDYLDNETSIGDVSDIQKAYFKAFATTAFKLWTRNEELVNFQYGELTPHQISSSGQQYHNFRLIFRKTNKDPNNVQNYMIPSQSDMPEIDCYAHISAWLKVLRSHLQRPLKADDYLFPALASTGKLKLGEPMTRAGIEKLLDLIVAKSGVLNGRNGRFTTHCFRRGGAQYRFMWAESKWSLKAVKWWGGWASGENVGTIMRYLLDELTAYEEGFSDILMDDRKNHRHENFMGVPDPSTPVTLRDLDVLGSKLGNHLESLLLNTPGRLDQYKDSSHHNTPPLPSLFPALLQAQLSEHALPTATSSTDPPPSPPQDDEPLISEVDYVLLGSKPTRIPVTHTMDDVIRYWLFGDPARGLIVPLQHWKAAFSPKSYKSEAQKLSNIRLLYEEYAGYCGGDQETFKNYYPGTWSKFSDALRIVRIARIERGDAKPRRSRK